MIKVEHDEFLRGTSDNVDVFSRENIHIVACSSQKFQDALLYYYKPCMASKAPSRATPRSCFHRDWVREVFNLFTRETVLFDPTERASVNPSSACIIQESISPRP